VPAWQAETRAADLSARLAAARVEKEALEARVEREGARSVEAAAERFALGAARDEARAKVEEQREMFGAQVEELRSKMEEQRRRECVPPPPRPAPAPFPAASHDGLMPLPRGIAALRGTAAPQDWSPLALLVFVSGMKAALTKSMSSRALLIDRAPNIGHFRAKCVCTTHFLVVWATC
jgi:hypothetical protein